MNAVSHGLILREDGCPAQFCSGVDPRLSCYSPYSLCILKRCPVEGCAQHLKFRSYSVTQPIQCFVSYSVCSSSKREEVNNVIKIEDRKYVGTKYGGISKCFSIYTTLLLTMAIVQKEFK